MVKLSESEIACNDDDGNIQIWNFVNSECLLKIKDYLACSRNIFRRLSKLSKTKFFSISDDETIKIWNKESGNCLKTVQCDTICMAIDIY